MKTITKFLLGATILGTATAADAQYLSGTPLTEPGEGEVMEYSRDCISYFSIGGMMTSIDSDLGGAVQMVTSPDNKVWFNYPLPNFPLPNWVEGTIDGNTMTVELPQAIYIEEGSTYFLAIVTHDEDDNYFMKGDQTLKLTREGEVWSSVNCEANSMLGLVADDGAFMGTGAFALSYTPFSEEWQEAPAGIETERYAFVNKGSGQFINIGFDVDDCWIQGLLSGNEDSWIRGTRTGDEVTFPAGQYLGVWESDEFVPHHCWFMTGETLYDSYTATEGITFSFDEASKTYSSDKSIIFNFCSEPNNWNYVTVADSPVFTYQPESETLTRPTNPSMVTSFDGSASAYIPQTAIDGSLIDADNLYYRLYIDGNLYTFYNDEYKFLDVEEMTDIPYNYTEGYDFFIFDAYREIYLYLTDYEVVGFQSVLKRDGRTLVSDIVSSDGTVTEVEAEASVDAIEFAGNEHVEYYDLQGRRINGNATGLVIRKTVRSNGEVSTDKIIK